MKKNLLPSLIVAAVLYLVWVNGYDQAAVAVISQAHMPSVIAGVVLGFLGASAL